MVTDELTHLHAHSDQSAFDGIGKPPEFIEKAAEMGQTAIALTEHGSLRGLYGASVEAEKTGIKLIPGIEMYLADDATQKGLSLEEKAEIKRRNPGNAAYKDALSVAKKARTERDHITVWAINDVGLRNLYRLTSWSWGPGYYFKPRVDLEVLARHSEGLAVSSGCPGGVIPAPLRAGNFAEAMRRARFLAETFGDRFLVEIMPHVPEENCVGVAEKLARIADTFGATLIATQDAHYPHEEDAVSQEALLCIHTKSKMDAEDRFVFDARDYWLKSRFELEQAFAKNLPGIPRALARKAMDNTMHFAERCSAKVAKPKAGAYLVAPPLPDDARSYDAWLQRLCLEGVHDRGFNIALFSGGDYRNRLQHELKTIRDLGFARYFLSVWDVRRWSREQGIMCGPGRGSGAGSLVCYLLRITDLDPIFHGLLFERFLAPGRVDLPDLDLDFESLRRQEVVDYLRKTYGDDKVAHISTHNTLGGKQAIRDLGRIFGVPTRDVANVAALISDQIEEELQTEDTLTVALTTTEVGRAFAERYPDVAAVAGRLEGQLRGVGMHAAGVVMSTVPLADICPVESRPRSTRFGADADGESSPIAVDKSRIAAIAYDMKGVEAIGLVKLDVLGLTTLSMLRVAFETAGRTVEEIALDDPETLQGFTDGRYAGIFQYDTPGSRRLCRGYTFAQFSDVAVMTALNRPGPAKTGLAREFIERALDPTKIKSIHPVYDRVFAETHGVPVYQEQIVSLVRELGYSPEDADKFRKKVSKKIGLSDEEPKFIEGAISVGMSESVSLKLFHSIVGFAAYCFNKSHSYSYGALAFWSMWLKVRHPAEFYAGALRFKTKPEVQMRLAAEARKAEIPVKPPNVNQTGVGFAVRTVEDGSLEITGSIADLKGIGSKTAKIISNGAPYTDLTDFYARTAGTGARITAKTFGILTKVAALRELFPHARFLAMNSALVWKNLRKGLCPVLHDDHGLPDFTEDELTASTSGVWPLYINLAGRGAFEAAWDRARSVTKHTLLIPGEALLTDPGGRLLFGRTAALKLFHGDAGKSGRAVLVSGDGDESWLRVDGDVLDGAAELLGSSGRCVVAVIWTGQHGGHSLESVHLVDAALDGSDPLGADILGHFKTKPKDPAAALRAIPAENSVTVEGMIVRVRRHVDKSGGNMLTCGLLGETGYTRFFVFARRRASADVKLLQPGARVVVRLKKLDDFAACLADAEIREP